MKYIEYLKGKKTYLVTLLTAFYSLAKAFGWLNTTPEQDITVYTLLAALFGMTISAKINRTTSR